MFQHCMIYMLFKLPLEDGSQSILSIKDVENESSGEAKTIVEKYMLGTDMEGSGRIENAQQVDLYYKHVL